ncbi:membrane-associated protein Hem [Lepeophtheirus salmonis]|uniref:Uncharacterized protein n=1 Tax=Lepeophtheirus salmonis TaxID=72036 RepID=A0A0K2U2N8_LEPSM|nr:membrane-associated protein Hem-like [Lepeophtheirus salmonis]
MALNVSQQKIAEKLYILGDRGAGMLTRVYNIKKACSDANSKPAFLSDKSLDSAVKVVVRRFPNADNKSLSVLQPLRNEILKSLSLYYYTFVDLLDYRDHVGELLTTLDACGIVMDITRNFDLTKAYLNVVSTYASLMILLSRVEDRKAVLGLYNAAHEMIHSHSDVAFPRLGNMIVEYDNPLKKLAEEFGPHSQTLTTALLSLASIYPRRNLSAEKWRSAQMLSLVSNPGQLLNPAHTDTIPCEYLSLEVIEKWIIFGFVVCHSSLSNKTAAELWKQALSCNWIVSLFRDEVLYIHSHIQSFFESIKGYNKKVNEVKDYQNAALQSASILHRERRKFLRSALRELVNLCSDQPGLLGPKALFIFMGLCFSRDEIVWLIQHHENPPARQTKYRFQEDLIDRYLPELLFLMEECRALVRKYGQVIQRYYVQYLSGYDAVALNKSMQSLTHLSEDDSIILSSICQTISDLTVEQVEDPDHVFDFRGLRLDWCRLQSYTSSAGSNLIRVFQQISGQLNTITFHTRLVDGLEDMLTETSDLGVFCFYCKLFEDHFQMCLEFPAQNRFIIAFPLICGHFSTITNDFCPEERTNLRERSLSLVNTFLDEMAKEAKNIISTICEEQCNLSDKLLPKHCAPLIAQVVNKKKRDKSRKIIFDKELPGSESYRKTREDLTTMDKLHMALTELCYSINYTPTINVWEYTFAPREYLNQHLETRFARDLADKVMFNPETSEIAKPSELLTSVRAYMNVLQSVENYVSIDITRIFNNVLLQQTQQTDSNGDSTITSAYTQWYSDILLRRVSAGHICFSPTFKSFVSLTADGAIPFNADEFSDPSELRALTELIGPYGIHLLNETLMWHIGSQVQELKKLVLANKDVLLSLRTNFDKPDHMRELAKRLTNVDSVLQRMTIIGVILSFRELLYEAVNAQLEERIPFLYSTIQDFHQHSPPEQSLLVNEMASAAGFTSKLDPLLLQQLANLPRTDEEYLSSCLLMVFVAISIPKLAKSESSTYKAQLDGHSNNIHCLANAINQIFGALFSICGRDDIEDRLKEFLALASSSLLRLAQENVKEEIRNRESVYILLDMIVQKSPFLSMDLLESCFPYTLLRNSYHIVHKMSNMQIAAIAQKAS